MSTSRRIGFISTRFAGTDGVSLETAKWATVLERMGHSCYYFCGECDRPAGNSYVVPEAFYRHPAIESINQTVFTANGRSLFTGESAHPEIDGLHQDFFSVFIRPAETTRKMQELKEYLKDISTNLFGNSASMPLSLKMPSPSP